MYIKSYVTERGNWYEYATEYLVPKILGMVNTKIGIMLRFRKLLPLGHRLRNSQEEIL